ncbi:hypothetical protein EYV94_01075 [Puteibacter caeruleilacunae]|nr:hypothetical protein EYV94_01075 [Puteibacter caeruleilacunae]
MRVIALLIITAWCLSLNAQTSLKGDDFKIMIDDHGRITRFETIHSGHTDTVSFQQGEWAGPSWYGSWDDTLRNVTLSKINDYVYEAITGDIQFKLEYSVENGVPALEASVTNVGYTPIQPEKLGLRLGLNTYMEKYPDWNHKFFPTMMRCEKTHFWGYAMAPDGRVLCMASPDPVASWSTDFTKSWGEPNYKWFGHRITSSNIDLMNALPLPERHPHNLYELKKGETKRWKIYLSVVDELEQVGAELSRLTKAPFFDLPKTTIGKHESLSFKIKGDVREVVLINPSGKQEVLTPENNKYTFSASDETGVFKMVATASNGTISEAMISVRNDWQWYMNQAREAALKYPARATTHCETWYGLYTMYLGEKYVPNTTLLEASEARFQNIFPQLYDTVKLVPTKIPHRIQNTSSMIGVLVDRYEATGDMHSLKQAAKLADWIIEHAQAKDGSYRAGKTHYTSVIYPAKSIMELYVAETKLAKKSRFWKDAAARHYQSVKRAMDELVASGDNIDTEGQLTYEDGMISCSALQLELFALLQKSEDERAKYMEAGLKLLQGHRSLTQLLIPDSRMRNGTMRFWESQYDVYIQPNMFNSPHGWTSWRTYATYYAYLLTGEEDWLRQTFNALGSSVQVIDFTTGDLRWGFVPSPYVKVVQTSKPHMKEDPDVYSGGHFHPRKYPHREYILGEQYVDMISDWIRANSQDNDVHEHFKCMEETVLANAFVIERDNGELVGYNCKVADKGGVVEVVPTEEQIKNVHFNVKGAYKVLVKTSGGEISEKVKNDEWVRW